MCGSKYPRRLRTKGRGDWTGFPAAGSTRSFHRPFSRGRRGALPSTAADGLLPWCSRWALEIDRVWLPTPSTGCSRTGASTHPLLSTTETCSAVLRYGLARILPDGTVDPEFAAPRRDAAAFRGQRIDSVFVADDGESIRVAGSFSGFAGYRAPGILKLDASGNPVGGTGFAVRSTGTPDAPVLIAGASGDSIHLVGAVQSDGGAATPGVAKLVRTASHGTYWHPMFGEIHGYGTGAWFHIEGLGLLYHYDNGWHGHYTELDGDWIQAGVLGMPRLAGDDRILFQHSVHGWVSFSVSTGLHYRWSEGGWFDEWR